MTRPIRVLWLIRGLGPGGAERLLVAQAANAGDAIHYEVAYQVAAKDHLVPELEAAGVTVHLVGSGPQWPLELRRLVAEREIDLVHSHSPAMAAAARIVLRAVPGGPRPVLVYTEHNRWGAYRRPTRWANACTFALEHRVIAVSGEARRSIAGPLRNRVQTVHHGVDGASLRRTAAESDPSETRAGLGIGPDAIVALNVANFRVEKAHEVLVDAAQVLDDEDSPVVIVLVGQGQRLEAIEALIAERGLGHRIRLVGYRQDVPALLAASDCLVLSSDHEGLPVAVMEALSLGLPVVSTDVGGIPEAIDDEVEGLLVAPRDPAALAAALGRLADPALRARLGAAATIRGRDFDAATASGAVEAIYRSALGGE